MGAALDGPLLAGEEGGVIVVSFEAEAELLIRPAGAEARAIVQQIDRGAVGVAQFVDHRIGGEKFSVEAFAERVLAALRR